MPVMTPLDEFDGWKREGERKLAQLISYREGAVGRLDAARAELEATDKAIDELSVLLGRVSPTLLNGGDP